MAQPAEETIQGAKQMVKDGLFKRFPKPNYGLALHTHAELPAGSIFFKKGPTYASSDSVDLTFTGKGGHGAAPHLAVDPFIMMAEMTLKLQTIVGREVDPIQPAPISVGSVHGGTKHNIIPDSEDFGVYGREGKFPTAIYWVGPQDLNSKGPFYINHNSKFAPDFKHSINSGIVSMSLSVLIMNSKAQ